MKAQAGQNVSVHYRGTLSDGTEFDNSRKRGQTLDFQLGSGQLLAGFNDTVVGMTTGETRTVTLTSEQAYGAPRPEAIQKVPRTAFDPDFEFVVGGTVQGQGPSGPFIAKIQEVSDSMITLDLNHPLAGKDITFEVELVSVNTATPEPTMVSWSASMKKAELYEIAKMRGLPVNTRSTKAQIIEALSN